MHEKDLEVNYQVWKLFSHHLTKEWEKEEVGKERKIRETGKKREATEKKDTQRGREEQRQRGKEKGKEEGETVESAKMVRTEHKQRNIQVFIILFLTFLLIFQNKN